MKTVYRMFWNGNEWQGVEDNDPRGTRWGMINALGEMQPDFYAETRKECENRNY